MRRMFKLFAVASILALVFLAFAVPVFAQEPLPPTPAGETAAFEVDFAGIGAWLLLVVQVAVVLTIAATVGERGTEVIKAVLRKIGEFTGLKFIALNGLGSVLLSIFVAIVGVLSPTFNLEFFQQFELFQTLDPQLVAVFNVVILYLYQHYIHEARWYAGLFTAPKYDTLKFRQLGLPKKG